MWSCCAQLVGEGGKVEDGSYSCTHYTHLWSFLTHFLFSLSRHLSSNPPLSLLPPFNQAFLGCKNLCQDDVALIRPDQTLQIEGEEREEHAHRAILYIIAVKLKDWQPSFQHHFTNKKEKEEWPQTFVPSQVKIIFSCTSINQAISANTNANTKLALWSLLLRWGKKVLILDHSQNFYVMYIHSFGFLRNVLISPFRNLSGVSPWIK